MTPAAALAPDRPPRLAVRGVCARRGDREVLRGVSLEIAPGEIFGLLGPNGAGKSTLFGILAGLLQPTEGTFALDGRPIAPGARELRTCAGIVFQEPGLDGKLTAAFWASITALRRERGTTVVLATHRPDEAERCDRLAVLAGGAIVACETPDALRARVSGDVIVVDGDDREALARVLEARLGLRARVRADGVHVERPQGHTLVPRIAEAFPPGRLRSIALRRPTLADAYLAVAGAALDEELP